MGHLYTAKFRQAMLNRSPNLGAKVLDEGGASAYRQMNSVNLKSQKCRVLHHGYVFKAAALRE